MRLLAVVLLLAASTGVAGMGHAQDVVPDEPTPAVKACIAANASAVERAFESLNEGVDFLTTKLCASELSEQIMAWSEKRGRELEEQRRDWTKAVCEKQSERAEASNEARSSAYVGMMCDEEGDAALQFWGGAEAYISPWLTTHNVPKATSLAARTLLELRGKRPASTP